MALSMIENKELVQYQHRFESRNIIFSQLQETLGYCPQCKVTHYLHSDQCSYCGSTLESHLQSLWNAVPNEARLKKVSGNFFSRSIPVRNLSLAVGLIVKTEAQMAYLDEGTQESLATFWEETLAGKWLAAASVSQLERGELLFIWISSLEDSEGAHQAANAGLEMLRIWKALAMKLDQCVLHLGLNTGFAFPPYISLEGPRPRWIDEAHGLARQNTSGTLLCSSSIKSLLKNDYDFIGVPVHSLSSETSTGFICLGKRAPVSHILYDNLEQSSFVGRETELELLSDTLKDILAGKTHVVSLVAEPGVGKTRLIKEFLFRSKSRLEEASCILARGYGASYGSSPFGVIRLIMDDLIASGLISCSPAPWVERARQLAQAMQFGEQGLPSRSQRKATSHLAEDFIELIREISISHPLIVIADDLHWSDAESLKLLSHCVESLQEIPLLLLLSFRPSLFVHIPWEPLAPHTEIRLGSLELTAQRKLTHSLLTAQGLPVQLQPQILTQAKGNPLFVEHLVALLKEDPSLISSFSHQLDKSEKKCLLPSTLHETILSRIKMLDARVRQLGHLTSGIASMLNRGEVLQELDELEQQLGAWLDRLEGWEYADSAQVAAYLQQIHSIDVELVILSLLLGKRRPNDRRLSQMLERILLSCTREYLNTLAQAAEDETRSGGVVQQALLAADLLTREGRLLEVKDFLELCLAESRRSTLPFISTQEILERLGDVSFHSADLAKAASYYEAALQENRKFANHDGSTIICKLAQVFQTQDKARMSFGLLKEHLNSDGKDSAKINGYLALAYAQLDQPRQAVTYARKSRYIANRSPQDSTLALSWYAEAVARLAAQNQEKAEQAIRRALTLLPSAESNKITLDMFLFAALLWSQNNSTYHLALQTALGTAKLSRGVGSVLYQVAAYQLLTQIYSQKGYLYQAAKWKNKIKAMARRQGENN